MISFWIHYLYHYNLFYVADIISGTCKVYGHFAKVYVLCLRSSTLRIISVAFSIQKRSTILDRMLFIDERILPAKNCLILVGIVYFQKFFTKPRSYNAPGRIVNFSWSSTLPQFWYRVSNMKNGKTLQISSHYAKIKIPPWRLCEQRSMWLVKTVDLSSNFWWAG